MVPIAHFAKIENGVVTEVIVVRNTELDDNGNESEAKGLEFIASLGLAGEWVQTSYTGSSRGKFAGIGDLWDGTEFAAPPEQAPPA